MGKNDLWIAATARVLGAVLLTNDQDFGHLPWTELQSEYTDPVSLQLHPVEGGPPLHNRSAALGHGRHVVHGNLPQPSPSRVPLARYSPP
jgi:hypothetical protein